MVAFSPFALIAAANAACGQWWRPGDRQPPAIEMMLRTVRQSFYESWNAAFVSHVGQESHRSRVGSSFSTWPVPPCGTADDFARVARGHNLLQEDMEVGDIVLFANRAVGGAEFARVGIVVRVGRCVEGPDGVDRVQCVTIEGDTTTTGASQGTGVHAVERSICAAEGDRCFRWVDMPAWENR